MLLAQQISERVAVCNGQEYLFFSGTAYLAMNVDTRFRAHINEGLQKYGNNYGSSRNSNFQLDVFDRAEQSLADFAGAEDALTMSSGYMAGQLVMRSMSPEAVHLFAPDTHPALCLRPQDFYHGDFANWATSIVSELSASDKQEIVIACNSLDALLSVGYNFDWVAALPTEKNITVVVDDSHGFGITGAEGSGIFRDIRHGDNIRLIVVSSLGKAMGIPGGVIFSDAHTIAQLRRSPVFAGASPVAPAYLYAYLNSGSLYHDARTRLAKNIAMFDEKISATKAFTHKDGYPVFYTWHNDLGAFLEKKNILISHFAYPHEDDPLITRVIINSSHLDSDIEILTKNILSALA